MMPRRPEPEELMDDPTQALAYAEADFSESNTLFCDLFAAAAPAGFGGQVLDLGCGPADIPIRLARRFADTRITAVDGALAMLELAQRAIAEAGLSDRIRLAQVHLPATEIPGNPFSALISNSLLHHLLDPLDLWHTLAATAEAGARVLVMDLLRPESIDAAAALVERYAADAPEVLRRDFHNSLLAAYSLEEVREQLAMTGLDQLEVVQVSDRHLAVTGQMQR